MRIVRIKKAEIFNSPLQQVFSTSWKIRFKFFKKDKRNMQLLKQIKT